MLFDLCIYVGPARFRGGSSLVCILIVFGVSNNDHNGTQLGPVPKDFARVVFCFPVLKDSRS